MSNWPGLERFLTVDPEDAGCDETFELIDLYVELTLRGGGPELRFPRVAAHLRSCHPCAEDFDGLLLAVSS
jgi:hypothetical protein